ncbi:unnamed protein product [Rotaria sp. Silwood1]|nr:unnamed protein product [Rotaria sp. Silwood1]
MTSAKNTLFFSRFSFIDTTFPNLRSLALTHIKYDTWRFFKTRLPPLIVTFSIHLSYSDILACLSITSAILSELLFLSPLLKRLSVKMTGFLSGAVKIRPPNSAILSSVQYFHLESVAIDLLSLLAAAPMLQTLKGKFLPLHSKISRINSRLLYLQQLWIELWAITWTEMATLLSSFPRLTYLTVIADNVNNDMADGFAWARSLQYIKHFEFKLKFSYDAFEPPLNLDSFRTKFWLEEKKWFVTYDRRLNADNSSMLYSNSSSLIIYPPHEIIGTLVSESTALEPTSFSHVHRLIINDQYLKYPFLHRYTNIKELYLSQATTTFSTTLKDVLGCLDTSQIVTCKIDSAWDRNSSYELIEFLQSLPRLRRLQISDINLNYLFLHQWPHIVDLKIEHDFPSKLHVLCSTDINALCHSFTHIERLDIHSSSINNLPLLLNRMKKTLTDIIIRQPDKVNNQKLITHEWIEQNTELHNFHYTCDYWNSVRLWL